VRRMWKKVVKGGGEIAATRMLQLAPFNVERTRLFYARFLH